MRCGNELRADAFDVPDATASMAREELLEFIDEMIAILRRQRIRRVQSEGLSLRTID